LESKRNSLDYLEKQEIEASKIDDALKRGRQATTDSISTVGSVAASTVQDDASSTHHRQFTDGAFTQDPESEEGDESHNQSTNDMGDSTNPFAQPPTTQANPYAQAHTTSSNAPKRKSTRFNNVFNFSSISHTIHGIIDVDPEATRRSNIGRTREAITQVSIVSGFHSRVMLADPLTLTCIFGNVCNDSWKTNSRQPMQTWTRFREPYKGI